MTSCRSCGAPIVWATTSGGKLMPVDAEPVEDGNVELHPGSRPDTFTATVHPPGWMTMDPRPLYVSHFATCPHAEQHRRK